MSQGSIDFSINLIELVRERVIVWDTSHKEYKNIIKKNDAWKEIATQLNVSIEEAKKRWESIAATFRREKK